MTSEPFNPTPQRRSRATNVVNMRLKESGIEWLDETAEKFEVSRTEVLKAALALAANRPNEFDKLIVQRKAQL